MGTYFPDRPLSLFELGFRLRPVRGERRTRTYLEPYGIRILTHPLAKNVPMDGPWVKKDFSFPGGIFVHQGQVFAHAHLSNQMTVGISINAPLFSPDITSEYGKQTREEILEALIRNRKRDGLFLRPQRIHFPRYIFTLQQL